MQDPAEENFYHYNHHLQPFANHLRKTMTKAEACLWKYALRAGQMKGYSFRRQRPVLNYIADFMCKELKLVIEVDGLTHQDEAVIKKDVQKQSDLESLGFTVMRFTDEQVLTNMEGVKHRIEIFIEDWELNHPPTPRQRGT